MKQTTMTFQFNANVVLIDHSTFNVTLNVPNQQTAEAAVMQMISIGVACNATGGKDASLPDENKVQGIRFYPAHMIEHVFLTKNNIVKSGVLPS